MPNHLFHLIRTYRSIICSEPYKNRHYIMRCSIECIALNSMYQNILTSHVDACALSLGVSVYRYLYSGHEIARSTCNYPSARMRYEGYRTCVLCLCVSVCHAGANLRTGTSRRLTKGTGGLSGTFFTKLKRRFL